MFREGVDRGLGLDGETAAEGRVPVMGFRDYSK